MVKVCIIWGERLFLGRGWKVIFLKLWVGVGKRGEYNVRYGLVEKILNYNFKDLVVFIIDFFGVLIWK